MKHVILSDSKKYLEYQFTNENIFEKRVKDNSTLIFGPKSIYLDLKNLVSTRTLGGVIPDAFIFDFQDPENPEFYIVEIEL